MAIGFLTTSLALTVIAAKSAGDDSVLDRLGLDAPASDVQEVQPALTDGLLIPPTSADAPTAPPVSE